MRTKRALVEEEAAVRRGELEGKWRPDVARA